MMISEVKVLLEEFKTQIFKAMIIFFMYILSIVIPILALTNTNI